MTSTTGTTQHPDVSEISELTEGLLPPSRTAAVRRHLEDCTLCADVRASLEEIRDLLGTLPGPQRMPADVAGRIDAALAAEALLNATAPDDPARETTHVSRETASAATGPAPATTPVSTGSGLPSADRPAGHSRAATGPGRAAKARRRRAAVLSAVLGAAAIGAGIFFVQNSQSPTPSSRADHTTSGTPVPGGTVYSSGTLEGRVQSLLAAQHGQTAQSAPSAKIAPSTKNAPSDENSSDSVRSAVTVPSCVQAGTGRPAQTPLAAEQGTYEGAKVYLVVLPDQANPANVEAYIVDAACESAGPSAQGKLLLTHSYPRR
ncbi:anti-sigma factor family protein [Streptomyces sp. NBC_00212]|uniref:anti-sigma factor family protein n=1 Tax=Streptomyces sp. NBC_00212 TaxID=2975684 RepID=UPI0032455E9C